MTVTLFTNRLTVTFFSFSYEPSHRYFSDFNPDSHMLVVKPVPPTYGLTRNLSKVDDSPNNLHGLMKFKRVLKSKPGEQLRHEWERAPMAHELEMMREAELQQSLWQRTWTGVPVNGKSLSASPDLYRHKFLVFICDRYISYSDSCRHKGEWFVEEYQVHNKITKLYCAVTSHGNLVVKWVTEHDPKYVNRDHILIETQQVHTKLAEDEWRRISKQVPGNTLEGMILRMDFLKLEVRGGHKYYICILGISHANRFVMVTFTKPTHDRPTDPSTLRRTSGLDAIQRQ